ncbi:hypothetical protein SELMODRAFT_416165 [Selaginella moellendorffii]|uniref:Uncharacterized protein n=1 Tax=Selaginella moellendorffii TaxID=88036 RepID=D8RYA5_SELML|nr:hypothetical protein SELMODRAFT_416165 [Selaginella moellendorffii]
MVSTFVEMHGGMPVIKELIVDNDELMDSLAEAGEASKKRERKEEDKGGQPLKKVRKDDIQEEPCKDQGQTMASTFVEMHGGMPIIKELLVDNDELMEALAEAGKASKKRQRKEDCKDGQPLKMVKRDDAREEPCKDQGKSRGPIIVRIKLHKKGDAVVKEPCNDRCKDQVARIELHKENKESSSVLVEEMSKPIANEGKKSIPNKTKPSIARSETKPPIAKSEIKAPIARSETKITRSETKPPIARSATKTVARAIKPCNTARKASQQRRSHKELETSASMKIECVPVKKVLNARCLNVPLGDAVKRRDAPVHYLDFGAGDGCAARSTAPKIKWNPMRSSTCA